MSIALHSLGVAFASFCVWLAVLIVNRRERRAKWTAVALLALPLLYVVSFGPTCWMLDRGWIGYDTPIAVYRPLRKLFWHLPEPAFNALKWWGAVGSDEEFAWFILLLDIEGA